MGTAEHLEGVVAAFPPLKPGAAEHRVGRRPPPMRVGGSRLLRAGVPRFVTTILAYIGAALAEIAGCFAFWAWLRLGHSAWWLVPGGASLALFASLLTLVESDAAGRAYAACGEVYIAASILWLWAAEGRQPDRWDVLGGAACLAGTAILLLGAARSSE